MLASLAGAPLPSKTLSYLGAVVSAPLSATLTNP
jgi:hypothetical protein